MKTGIIIIFHNYEEAIDTHFLIDYFNKAKSIEFCLVNNESTDQTYFILKEIKELCDNVSIVNVKKFKSDISAVKAGARYMINQNNFKHLGYINTNQMSGQKHSLSSILKALNQNYKAIINFNLKTLHEQKLRQSLFQKLFPIIDYLNAIEIEETHLELITNNRSD